MGYSFDGQNKLIILTSTGSVDVSDLYSRWKDWVLEGNAQYVDAFRSVAGDPVGNGVYVAPYIFLNNTAGWRIRPAETAHVLEVQGNLYPENKATPMFVRTVGGYDVVVTIERSSSAMAVATDGGGGGMTPGQEAMLAEIYALLGLDPTKPLVNTRTSRAAGDIHQVVSTDGTTLTVRRQ